MSSRYFTYKKFLKEKFNDEVYKVSLDGGFTCPNRDGVAGFGGCTFCSESGSGEFAGNKLKSISEQIDEQLLSMEKKIKDKKVIAYFQNFTNTYGDVEYLKKIYFEAINHPRVVGLAIGTRPDCLSEEVLDLLELLNDKTFLFLEIGLQSIDDEVAENFNRGYKSSVYLQSMKKLKERNIKFVTHLILGLPKSNEEKEINSALAAVAAGSFGLKIHLLYYTKDSRLLNLVKSGQLQPLTKDEYVDRVVKILRVTPKSIVIHRLTGDAKKSELVAPMWSGNKIDVLNSIEKKLKSLGAEQGDQCN